MISHRQKKEYLGKFERTKMHIWKKIVFSED